MAISKIMNNADRFMHDSLEGFGKAHAALVDVDSSARLIFRRIAKSQGKVAVISGGGSGHEPMHSGFVGQGMLDAACAGEVFTSPTPDQIVTATERVDRGEGVLYLVKNYAGDTMNFEMAADMTQARTATAVIDDDVALLGMGSGNQQGNRGVAGTVVVEKMVGALAERGADLEQCCALALDVNARLGTMAVALSSCTVPALGKPTFDIQAGEVEIGVGIHGEPGRAREHLQSAEATVDVLVTAILEKLAPPVGSQLLLFSNGLGGTPAAELYILFNEASRILEKKGFAVARSLVGNYCTALDMAGASLTVAVLTNDLIGLWDDPVRTPALVWP